MSGMGSMPGMAAPKGWSPPVVPVPTGGTVGTTTLPTAKLPVPTPAKAGGMGAMPGMGGMGGMAGMAGMGHGMRFRQF